jgi:hypothetical protein
VVSPMRPQIHPVDELASALATARDPRVDWEKVRDDLIGSDPVRALDGFSRSLRGEARANEARILIPIDQAEELFGVADPDEARRFLAILSQALSESLPFMAIMTIRSDFLGQLQSATSLTARFEEFSLGPMPLSRIPQVIEGPARRTGLRVEDEFVQQAAHDAETEDALPLLAFTLRQLSDQSARDQSKEGCLTLQAYKSLGDEAARLGPLENAVRKAADAVLDEANATDEEKTTLREAFVPAMVRVNEQGEYVRRPARMDALPATSNPLLERLAKARLLIIRQKGDARIVEVAQPRRQHGATQGELRPDLTNNTRSSDRKCSHSSACSTEMSLMHFWFRFQPAFHFPKEGEPAISGRIEPSKRAWGSNFVEELPV